MPQNYLRHYTKECGMMVRFLLAGLAKNMQSQMFSSFTGPDGKVIYGYLKGIACEGGKNLYILTVLTDSGIEKVCVEAV
jgi:hypothetical protein